MPILIELDYGTKRMPVELPDSAVVLAEDDVRRPAVFHALEPDLPEYVA